MSIERTAVVVAVEHALVRLILQAGCAGCGGCGGRCDLRRLLRAEGDQLILPRALFAEPVVVGNQVKLCVGPDALVRNTLSGYGLPVLGLLVGALTGAGIAGLFGWSLNLTTLVGAISGTFVGTLRSKSRLPLPEGLRVH